jgi:hypothetical protein
MTSPRDTLRTYHLDIWREDLSSFASCHPERSEGSSWPHAEILSEAKDDKSYL